MNFINNKIFIFSVILQILPGCTAVESVLSVTPETTLPEPMDVSMHSAQAGFIEDRLFADFLLNNYVISKENNQQIHLGDSILWTMLAASSLPCERAKPLLSAVANSVIMNKGLVLRIEPLPPHLESDPTSRDMEIGFAFGMTVLFRNCPEYRPLIRQTWGLHADYVFSQSNSLSKDGPRSKTDITPTIRYLLTEVSHYILEDFERPSVFDQFLLDTSTNLAALGRAISRKESCYPIHLTTLTFLTLDTMGSPLGETNKILFCKSTKGLGLSLTDWYCKRPDALQFLEHFKLNQFEYRHQRCDFEGPDGQGDLESPGVDFLIAYAAFGGGLVNSNPIQSD